MKKSFLSIILVIAITAFDTIPVLSAEFTSGYDVEESWNDDMTEFTAGIDEDVPDINHVENDEDIVKFSTDDQKFSEENELPETVDNMDNAVTEAAKIYGVNSGIYDYRRDLLSSDEKNAVKQTISEIILEQGITNQNTDLEKVCMLTAWFRKNTTYSSSDAYGNQSPYGSLVLRRAVCAGFATGMSALLTEIGIKNYVRTGSHSGSEGHAWVEVFLNGKYYILDATATCYNAGSFLEDYDHFWYNATIFDNGHSNCGSEYSAKGIPTNLHVTYLGANGNTLYVRAGRRNYYMNSGTGWRSVDYSNIPTQLWGSADLEKPKEVEHITTEKISSRLPIGSNAMYKFYVTNPGAANSQAAADSLSCLVADGQVASAEIIERKAGCISVKLTGLAVGNTVLKVFAPNGVECLLNIKVSRIPVPVLKASADPGGISEVINSITWKLNGVQEKDVLVDGYQIVKLNEKTGKYKQYETVEAEKLESYWLTSVVAKGYTKKFKVRAYIDGDNGKTIYGKYSNIVTISPQLLAPKVISVINMSNGKMTIQWSIKDFSAKGYDIYRKTGKDGTYRKIKTFTYNIAREYEDANVIKGKKYYYKVKAFIVRSDGTKVYSKYSNVKSKTCK